MNGLLLIDLCTRLPYGVKFTFGKSIYTMKGIDLIVTDEGDWEYAVTAKGIELIEIKYVKPYLRPMSSMTEEEKEEFRQRFCYEWEESVVELMHYSIEIGDADCLIDWLNAHHFDYRGLIEKGLALEAPADMYKF